MMDASLFFSELEPQSSLETSSSSFYRAEPAVKKNLPKKALNIRGIECTYFIEKDCCVTS